MDNDTEDDTFGSFTHGQGCAVGSAAVIASFVISYVATEGQEIFIGSSVAVLLSMLFVFSPLTKRTWFWSALWILSAAHGAVAALMPWPEEWLASLYGVQLVPLMWCHFALVTGLIWGLSRLMR